jgi:hypothetical protein
VWRTVTAVPSRTAVLTAVTRAVHRIAWQASIDGRPMMAGTLIRLRSAE